MDWGGLSEYILEMSHISSEDLAFEFLSIF